MCFVSTPKAATPSSTPPQYMHNPYLDTAGGGNPNFTGSQNELGAGFQRQSPNAVALAGNPGPNVNAPGLQTPNMGPAPGATPGLVIPSPHPGLGGVFAGAVPAGGDVGVKAK